MHPDNWDEFTEDDLFWEMFKPFRNQPWSHFFVFMALAFALSFALFNGVLLVTDSWESVIIQTERTQTDIWMAWIAISVTVGAVSLYMITGFAYAKGAPTLNLLSSFLMPWIAVFVTGTIFTTSGGTPFLEPHPFFTGPRFLALPPAVVPWAAAILWKRRLESRDPERVREFEQRHMPFPFKLDQLLEENKER